MACDALAMADGRSDAHGAAAARMPEHEVTNHDYQSHVRKAEDMQLAPRLVRAVMPLDELEHAVTAYLGYACSGFGHSSWKDCEQRAPQQCARCHECKANYSHEGFSLAVWHRQREYGGMQWVSATMLMQPDPFTGTTHESVVELVWETGCTGLSACRAYLQYKDNFRLARLAANWDVRIACVEDRYRCTTKEANRALRRLFFAGDWYHPPHAASPPRRLKELPGSPRGQSFGALLYNVFYTDLLGRATQVQMAEHLDPLWGARTLTLTPGWTSGIRLRMEELVEEASALNNHTFQVRGFLLRKNDGTWAASYKVCGSYVYDDPRGPTVLDVPDSVGPFLRNRRIVSALAVALNDVIPRIEALRDYWASSIGSAVYNEGRARMGGSGL